MESVIRPLKEEEVGSFYSFLSESIRGRFPEYTEKTREYFAEKRHSRDKLREELKAGARSVLVAAAEGKYAGFLMYEPLFGGVAFCNWLVVKEELQGRGLASRLLEEWERISREAGAHKLIIWTNNRNVEFYKKRGFILVGNIPDNYFGATDYLLYKSIQEPKEENYLR